MPPLRLLAVGVAIAGLLSGCANASPSASFVPGKIKVAVALYPIEEIVRSVGGAAVSVVELVPPGESAHDYEPTPQQIAQLQSADMVFFLGGGFQPNIEKAISTLPSRVRKVDLLASVPLIKVSAQLPGTAGTTAGEVLGDGSDPHVWLSPDNMKLMTVAVSAAFTGSSGVDKAAVAAQTAAFSATLDALDATYRSGLAHCASNVIVTSHRAFGYLAKAYGLEQIAISGVSPSEEPSAKTLEAVARAAKQRSVRTIFFEQNLPADLSKTVAREVGATTAVLDPIESLSKEQLDAHANYVSVMKQNLAALQKGLGCS